MIKKAVTSSVEHVYDLVQVNAGTPAPTSRKLLEDMNYIYPWDPKVRRSSLRFGNLFMLSQDGFNRRAPYENTVIKSALRAAFFAQQQYLSVGLQNSTLFKSTTDASTEIEIPADMLALTMTAVWPPQLQWRHVLIFFVKGGSSAFRSQSQPYQVRLWRYERTGLSRTHGAPRRLPSLTAQAIPSGHARPLQGCYVSD